MFLIFNQQTGEQLGASESAFPCPAGRVLVDAEDFAAQVPYAKLWGVQQIKMAVASQIAATDWRLQRATERDVLGVAGESIAEVMAEREAIRRAGNRAERELQQLPTLAQIAAFSWQVTAEDRLPAQVLSPLQFLRRFLPAERTAIEAARQHNAQLDDYFRMLEAAQRINLGDSDIVQGVQLLEKLQLLAAGRAAVILQPAEKKENAHEQ